MKNNVNSKKGSGSVANSPESFKLKIESLEFRQLLSASGWDVVLLDETLGDSQMLIDSTDADAVVYFNPVSESPLDVLDRVSDLAKSVNESIDSLTILSHGSEGGFILGNEMISAGNVSSLETSFRSLARSLTDNASIFIASCNAGAGAGGQLLLDEIAFYTSVNVYASDDITGASGDWVLEAASFASPYANVSPFNQALLAEYQHDLVFTDNLLENAEFEEPDMGHISNDWSLIPGWNSDGVTTDSGVQEMFPGQGYSAVIRDIDPSFYQTTTTAIAAGEVYTLKFRATDTWTDIECNGSNDPGNAVINATIYYEDNGVRVPLSSYSFGQLRSSFTLLEPSQYVITFDTADNPAAIGKNIGVEFDNVTPSPVPNLSWIMIDDVSLTPESNTDLSSEFFNVGDINPLNLTTINDTVNGVAVNYDIVSNNGHYFQKHSDTVITNSALKDIFKLTSDTSVQYMNLNASDLQAQIDLSWQTTDQSVYLVLTDIDLEVDIVTLQDNLGNPLEAYSYLGTYDPASEANASPRYNYDPVTGVFNNTVNEWTGEYFSVFDISGLEDISILAGGTPGANTSFYGYAVFVVDFWGPDATNDTASTNEDIAKVINVFANDSDADGNGLSISAMTDPAHGVIVDNGNGTITYTPDVDYNGADSFTYTIIDNEGSASTATVNITVNAVNDAPVGTDDEIIVSEDHSFTSGNLLANDIDVDNDVFIISGVTNGTYGSVENNGNGTITYTPVANYNGVDSFTYTITDVHGASDTVTVSVTINPVNDSPLAVGDSYLLNEDETIIIDDLLLDCFDIEGETLAIISVSAANFGVVVINDDNSLSYTPLLDFNGSDSFIFTISDQSGAIASAVVELNILPVEDSPLAVTDNLSYTGNRLIIPDLLANDYDPDGDQIFLVSIDNPEHGYLTSDHLGRTVYVMHNSYYGTEVITYYISDANGNIAQGQLLIINNNTPVLRPDNPPIVQPDYTADSDNISDASDSSVEIIDTNDIVTDDTYVNTEADISVDQDFSDLPADDDPAIDAPVLPDSSNSSISETITLPGIISDDININRPADSPEINTNNTPTASDNQLTFSTDKKHPSITDNTILTQANSVSRENDMSLEDDGVQQDSSQEDMQPEDSENIQENASENSNSQRGGSSGKDQVMSSFWERAANESNKITLVKDTGMAINIADEDMVKKADIALIMSDLGLVAGLDDDVVISPMQDELTAVVLNRQVSSFSNSSDSYKPESLELPEMDVTLVGGAVTSVAAGVALAQSGISLAAVSKSYAIITAIDP
ncbi:MAG: tandem-95 repeat protein, partial [Sedimentisphaerales bacterium]|nr:tandem-95 repeat protein [Sedimentisphaerales bacterium]